MLVPADLTTITCFGAPPTPVVVGGQPDKLGRMHMAIEVIRPQLPKATRACGMFQQALAIEMSR